MQSGPVAVVTASGSGLGAAIAQELHARGWRLVLMSPSGRAEELAARLGGIGVSGSVAEPADLERAVAAAMQAYGRIDGVANSTAHIPKGELLEIPDEVWHRSVDLVLLSVVRMARLVTPIMERQGGGAFVNVSTFCAFEPDPKLPVSSTLRAALGSFGKLYADRYAAAGIRMNNILPGFIENLPQPEETRRRIPLGRLGKLEEIAKTAAFLLSPDAGYITGQNIRVDGGLSRSV